MAANSASDATRSGERERADSAPASDPRLAHARRFDGEPRGAAEPAADKRARRDKGEVLRKGYLPRLDPGYYRGRAFVHWTLTLEHRATAWLTPRFHTAWQNVLLHAAARYAVVSPLYVLMPDHLHLLLLGLGDESDQRIALAFIRTHTTKALAPARWQKQAHDHVLTEAERTHDAFLSVAAYIQENPVRADLVADWREYPYLGCCVPGYPELSPRQDAYWELFWRIYNRLLDARSAGSARSRSPLPRQGR